MKYYSVKFTYEVPVAVNDDEEEVDAYYVARDKLSNYTVSEATVKIDSITEAKYNADKQTENRLHSSNE